MVQCLLGGTPNLCRTIDLSSDPVRLARAAAMVTAGRGDRRRADLHRRDVAAKRRLPARGRTTQFHDHPWTWGVALILRGGYTDWPEPGLSEGSLSA